jgi:hypothetical protein
LCGVSRPTDRTSGLEPAGAGGAGGAGVAERVAQTVLEPTLA